MNILNIKELVGLDENEKEIVIVQFLTQEELDENKSKVLQNYPNLRFIERDKEIEVKEREEPTRELTKNDWFNLEQSLYKKISILNKAINSSGNAFSFLLKVLSDGKTTGASEQTLQMAINMLMPNMVDPLNEEEIAYINQQLETNGFTIRI